MKFRTKHVPEIGYFAQVKKFMTWYTIGKHNSGEYGLYAENHTYYPLRTYAEAVLRCRLYQEWKMRLKNTPVYVELN